MTKRIAAAATFVTAVLFAALAHAQTRTNWIGLAGVEKAWDEGNLGAARASIGPRSAALISSPTALSAESESMGRSPTAVLPH